MENAAIEQSLSVKQMTSSLGTISYQQGCGGTFRIFPAGCPYTAGTYRHTKPAVLSWRGCPGRLGSRCDRNTEMQTCFVRLCVVRSECISSNLICFHRVHQRSKVTVLHEISVKQEKFNNFYWPTGDSRFDWNFRQNFVDQRYSNNTPDQWVDMWDI